MHNLFLIFPFILNKKKLGKIVASSQTLVATHEN